MHSSSSRERSRQVADLSKRREAQIYSGTARLPAPAGKKTALWRLLTDRAYATRVIRYFLRLPVLLNTQDRPVLEHREYWTIDASAKARKFGARRHRVAGLEKLDQHFPERYFGVLYCNGVYGFGLDAAPDIERAVEMCWSRLRDGGYFIFGWK
jgi:hypothetical protein